jgi:hypothetical protein
MVPPCELPHHKPGSRVQFTRWDRRTHRMVTVRGTVVNHWGRVLTIDTRDGRVTTSCGHVGAEVAS